MFQFLLPLQLRRLLGMIAQNVIAQCALSIVKLVTTNNFLCNHTERKNRPRNVIFVSFPAISKQNDYDLRKRK